MGTGKKLDSKKELRETISSLQGDLYRANRDLSTARQESNDERKTREYATAAANELRGYIRGLQDGLAAFGHKIPVQVNTHGTVSY